MNFILEDYISDTSLCDKIVDLYAQLPNKKEGAVGDYLVNHSIKKCTETFISVEDAFNNEHLAAYINELVGLANKYVAKYPESSNNDQWGLVETIKIQHYLPNEGYFGWHCERGSATAPMCNRHLVFITYLNDVEDGGETEFKYQNIKVKPKKGLTVIFPADWTHTHRGITSPTSEKTIITGWFNFIPKDQL